MRSPKDMGIIEIDITNACVHQCSNCTRFCGHHEKPFFMSFEQFKQAVDSLEGYEGMIGVIGGEPTLHPDFEKIVQYLREKRIRKRLNISWGPITNMQYHIVSTVNTRPPKNAKAVLLSSISSSYYKHYEVINNTFEYQLLNDHSSESLHQALLMSRQELNISYEEWIKKRDSCWIQNTWSATITPKGAFFCEVAGALDMLMNGEGGWPIEPGWWKRTPEEFVEQLHWCEHCSGCLDVPKRLAHDERDDVTPMMYEKLKKINSPKVKNNRVVVRRPEEYETYKDPTFVNGSEYIKAGDFIRMSSDNKSLYPKSIDFLSIKKKLTDDDYNKNMDWIVVTKEDMFAKKMNELRDYIMNRIWNPGYLYLIDDLVLLFNIRGMAVRELISNKELEIDNVENYFEPNRKIYLNMDDPLVSVIGGDSETVLARGERHNKKILVYGAGLVGKETINYMKECGIKDFEVVVTQKQENEEEVLGYKIHELEEYREQVNDILVIIAAGMSYHDEMVNELREIGIKNYRFLT